MRAHGGKPGVELKTKKRAHLIQRTVLDHAVEPRIDGGIERLTLRRDYEPQRIARRKQRRCIAPLPFGQGYGGRVDYFERTYDALRIGGTEACRHGQVTRGKLSVKGVSTQLLRSLAPIGPNLCGNVWDRRQSLGQRLEIEPGSPDQDRQPPLPVRFGNRASGIDKPATDGIGLRRGHGAVEAMGTACLIGVARPGRKQAKLAINLHGIGVDDRAA